MVRYLHGFVSCKQELDRWCMNFGAQYATQHRTIYVASSCESDEESSRYALACASSI